MPMTLEQLIKLFILQKETRTQSKFHARIAQIEFEEEYKRLMADVGYESSDIMAPSHFDKQPNIPFVLFKPQSASVQNPAPLIIHTHGGPHVYMDKSNLHAEIAYFISHGFVVACPNYRGSTDYPAIGDNPEKWKKWEKRSKDKHHIYGPQDVYVVAKCVMDMPFIAKEKVYLRGGSFGSCINSHLLAEIKKGTYENIFKGVHLSGGKNYPAPSSMPEDIQFLITHGKKDNICSFNDARIFMEKMLLKQLSLELEGIAVNHLQTFIAELGNHHLIDPDLQLDDIDSNAYQELETYLKHSTEFFHALVQGKKYQVTDSYDQYKTVMPNKDMEESSEIQILQQVYGYQLASQLAQKEPQVRSSPSFSTSLSLTAKSMDVSKCLDSSVNPVKIETNRTHYGPTCALLKLQLKDQFTGTIETDLTNYLNNHFAPIHWSTGKKLHWAGKEMATNVPFVKQMVQVIEQEESFLQHHPDHMVMYHTAEPNTLQLYTFINLWQAILNNEPINKLPIIKEMRLYEFMKKSFDDIQVFLLKMRTLKGEEKYFNYIPGFPERAISSNPALISNAHSTAACSLWWYYEAAQGKHVPVESVIRDLLDLLGIYSIERLERYSDLFSRELQRVHKAPQAVLQQLFVPYHIAEQYAYTCQIWGEEFEENPINLASPGIIKNLRNDPFAFEQTLRTHKSAYTNHGNCEGFGDVDQGFNYANCLQLRYLPRNHEDIFTFSYFRNQRAHDEFVTTLGQLIREDFADFLAYGNIVPHSFIKDVETKKQTLISPTNLGIFKPKERLNLYAYEIQQQELYKGLVQNPTKELYGGILNISQTDKAKIQENLRIRYGAESRNPVYLFSLCLYLKGYTYYDLLQEAAHAIFVNNRILPEYREHAKKTYQYVLEMIELFSIPSSIKNVTLCGEEYSELQDLLQHTIRKYEYDLRKHQFIQPERECYPDYLFGLELDNAIHCVLRHARLAKEHGYGHDIESKIMHIY